MKKLFSGILILTLVCSMLGCSKTSEQQPEESEKKESVKEEQKEEQKSEKVTVSDTTYNPEDGTISLKVKNNTEYFIDSVDFKATFQVHETNGYGEDEVEEQTFSSPDFYNLGEEDFYDSIDEAVSVPIICHIEKGEEKEITFGLGERVNGFAAFSDPEVTIWEDSIVYRDVAKEDENDYNNEHTQYVPMEDEYEMELIYSEKGDIEAVNLTNTSKYQWDAVFIEGVVYREVEGLGFGLENLEQAEAEGEKDSWSESAIEVDRGATVTFELNEENGYPDVDYVANVKFEKFDPRENKE